MGFGWAKPGVKCVCIDDSWLPGSGGKDEFVVSGETYTISSVNGRSLNLVGIRPSKWISRFRPLVSLEDDISMFTALTNMSPIERLDRLKEMMDQ